MHTTIISEVLKLLLPMYCPYYVMTFIPPTNHCQTKGFSSIGYIILEMIDCFDEAPMGLRDCMKGPFFLRECVKFKYFLRECVKPLACAMRERPLFSA